MFPENRLSTSLIADAYTYPYTLTPPNKKTAYAMGGIALSNPSQGLNVQLWTAQAMPDGVYVTSPTVTQPIALLIQPNITELTLAFDQNMNYVLAYVQYGSARLYWFDTFLGQYVITDFPGAITPRVTLDDRRESQTTQSDLVLAYVKDSNLYFRLQRDRFQNEYLLKSNVSARLEQMGMNVKNRLQFKLKAFVT